ncbi:putative metalloprotease CJM1_0395 family protein [uncultured Azonexus sp.]|uniref:putative metalloprotease CJM1_0395 family protein n=1 Tax=uncultured Azonexus sp. TaxID=520307 RepID=UPI00260CD076|nr:putative metalloprotease CJM1_0395 family protein [uncultured Azonexus sp.]
MNVSGVSAGGSAYASVASRSGQGGATSGAAKTLTPEEQQQVAELKKIDRQVRQHEMAHMAAGAGMVTSGASYSYRKGPDGVNYAVAGEVRIDTSPGRTPEETVSRAQRIRGAALAPSDPSPQDRAVAAAATQMEVSARMEMSQQRAAAMRGSEEEGRGRLAAYDSTPRSAAGTTVNTWA